MKPMSNEDKLDLLADLMDPVGEIIGDGAVLKLAAETKLSAAAAQAIRGHKGAVLRILAAIEGEDPETYHLDGAVLLVKALARLNEIQQITRELFPTQAQSADAAYSGPAMEAIPGKGP
jgi:hypothetical protein